jgi:hypothetical protein
MFNIPEATADWRGLSVRQPEASFIVDGKKTVENRTPAGPFAHDRLAGTWILIHSSSTSIKVHPTLSRGCVLGLAKIKSVVPADLVDDIDRPWTQDGQICLVFDTILKLDVPLPVPGGLGLWRLTPSPDWSPSNVLSTREQNMTPTELIEWRHQQELRYRCQSYKRHSCLFHVLLAIQEKRFTISFERLGL